MEVQKIREFMPLSDDMVIEADCVTLEVQKIRELMPLSDCVVTEIECETLVSHI